MAEMMETRDTASLHIGLSSGNENEEGNTPLHVAASNGRFEECKSISRKNLSLITRRNRAGETPLFLAALHGHRKTFLWLHYMYTDKSLVSSTCDAPYIRDDNHTILHCALAQGNIGFAIDIVLLYKDHLKKMLMRNKNGLSPLHFLAATPSAFQSTDLPDRPFIVKLHYHWFSRVNKKEQAMTKEELEKGESRPCVSALLDALMGFTPRFSDDDDDDDSCWWYALFFDIIVGFLCLLAMFLLVPAFVIEQLYLVAALWFRVIRKLKEKHTWSVQIMNELLQQATDEDMSANPHEEDSEEGAIVETPLMIAAQNGVIEMVDKILELFPSSLKVVNDEEKNTVLLTAEKRQTTVYQVLCEKENIDKTVFGQVDKDGNTALHLAAKPEVNLNWQTTNMIEEYKWFEFVKNSVPSELWEKYNNAGKTAEEIFINSYGEQMSSDREWLNQTSEACSVASTLVASMAFSNVTRNFDEENYSSLVALSFSLTSTISFLGILAFRSQSLNFWRFVPFMLHLAIFAMFGSIASLWISLMLHDHSLTTYAILGSPIAFLTMVSLPIFIGPTLMSMFTKVPAPSGNTTTSAIRYRRPEKKEN